jgi:adenosylhomocysteine nucleosidase
MASHRVAILAPMRSELRPLVKALGLHRRAGDPAVSSVVVGDTEIVATLTGIGTKLAAEATERIIAGYQPERVVVSGIAGALDGTVPIGQVLVPEVVVDGATGAEHRPSPLGDIEPHGRIWTSDELVLDEPRLARLRADGVVALDMETSAIGAVAERHGTPWSVFRAISDRATDGLVSEALLGLAKSDGSANVVAATRYLLTHFWQLPRLARLARDSNTAATAAARAAVRAVTTP